MLRLSIFFTIFFFSQCIRFYSSKLTPADIESKVLKVCKAFDKINAEKVIIVGGGIQPYAFVVSSMQVPILWVVANLNFV